MTATDSWDLWSTDARLVVVEPEALPKARRLVNGWLALVDDAANRFRPDSEVSLLSGGPEGPAQLSATLADLLTQALAAADRAAELVHQVLGTGVLVALGGDIATAGPAPDGGWQVLVQDRPEDRPTQIELAPGSAVATSSTVARQWRRGGRTLHHVVNPRTGQPAKQVWRSVTVAGPTCLAANAVSTAAIVRGDAAPAWVAGLGLPARFLRADGTVLTTNGWPEGVAA